MDNPKKCPKCGKKMIHICTNEILCTYPAQYPMKYWCKCGYEEKDINERGKTQEELNLEKWEELNKE